MFNRSENEPNTTPALVSLERLTNSRWPHIWDAVRKSGKIRAELEVRLTEYTNTDSSIFVVGSMAREEFTPGSDIDWALLLDGIATAHQLKVTHRIRDTIESLKLKQPSAEGVFGSMVSSHDLINNIGGQDDSNANTTLRILLLLESIPIGCPDAYERVLRNILFRYLDEDRGLWHGSGAYKVPRFLFNDVARYWRTVTVDFANKQRSRRNVGFALRNLKLRMSRKLIFLAGMVACFECHTGFSTPEERISFYASRQVQPLIERLRKVLDKSPLEIIAAALLPHQELYGHTKDLFTAYDRFLAMLADETPQTYGNSIREHLDSLPIEMLGEDEISARGREISHSFRDAIKAIFLSPANELGRLTIEYGVF